MSATSTPTSSSDPSLHMPRVVAVPAAAPPSVPALDVADVASLPDERTRRARARSRRATAVRALEEAVRAGERSYAALVERRDACLRQAAADRAILRGAGYLPA